MAKVITESGMDFIADNTFHIEQSALYKKVGKNIRTIEFIRTKGDMLVFVEAKTSFPNPNNPSKENLEKFQKAAEEILVKFNHSLNLFASVKVGVQENSFFDDFVTPEKVSLAFVLVIKDHEIKWCKEVQKKLENTFPKYLMKIWRPYFQVLNHEQAKKKGYVVNRN